MSGTDRNDNVASIAYHVAKDLTSSKYFGESQVRGSILACCHKHKVKLTPDEQIEVFNLVVNGLRRLGY